MQNVSATWQPPDEGKELFTGEELDADEDPSVIKNLTLELHKGEKVAIIGKVGSGKSSLLMTILGEMPILDGSVVISDEE